MDVDDLAQVLVELRAREPLFHRTELGTSRAWFEAATAEDFWEVGASGSVYDREFVWSVLAERYAAPEPAPDRWEVTDARVRRLAGEVYLFTYALRQGGRRSRRATVWQRDDGEWRAVYHQGTLVTG